MIGHGANLMKCMGFKNVLAVSVCIFPILFFCGCSRDSQDAGERLTAYCIRECVLQTSDSEVCDTKCKCAVEKLAAEASEEEFAELVNVITKTGGVHMKEYTHKFKVAFADCPGIK